MNRWKKMFLSLLVGLAVGACHTRRQPLPSTSAVEMRVDDSATVAHERQACSRGVQTAELATSAAVEMDSVVLTVSARRLRLTSDNRVGGWMVGSAAVADSGVCDFVRSGSVTAETQAATAAQASGERKRHGCHRWKYAALGAVAVLFILLAWKLRKPLFSCLGL